MNVFIDKPKKKIYIIKKKETEDAFYP